MAKKYLSLDEAAERIGATTERLLRLREEGEIRGFADRGSWKFREQDVEEFVRSQQADSSPDIPMMSPDADDDDSVLDDEGKVDLSASDSDVRLFFDETLFDDEEVDLSDSDSDVQLSGDSGPNLEGGDIADSGSVLETGDHKKQSDSDSDVSLIGGGTEADFDLLSGDTVPSRGARGELPGMKTDSDINLVPQAGSDEQDSDSDVLLTDAPGGATRDDDSDSDVLLTDSDSDVRLSSDSAADLLGDIDSDSDVHLVEGDSNVLAEDSDSDVKLGVDRTDSDIRLVEAPDDDTAGTDPGMVLPEDSDLKLIDSSKADDEDDSGITLESAAMGVGTDDSGISLEIDDSGISLEADDSGISLESLDSGTGFADDSGITLDAGDSGITLDAADSGIALFDDDSGLSLDDGDMGSTMPMKAVAGAGAALEDARGGQTTHMEIPQPDREDSDFELAGLDRDDDDTGTDTSVLMFDDGTGSHESIDAVVGVEDEFGTDEDFEEEFEEDLDDVWDAEDEVDDDFESGESQVDGFAAPAAGRVVSDAPWGTAWTTTVSVAAVFSALSAFIGVELVRTMWLWTQPGQSESWLLSILGGLF